MAPSTHSATEGTGITRAHTWGLIVPLMAALSPVLLSKYTDVKGLPTPINALLSGAVVSLVAYFLMTQVPMLKEKTYVLAKAVLCGLLVAEIMVLKPYGAIPSMGTVTLWLFFYYHTMEHLM
jgi:hypothetical protein